MNLRYSRSSEIEIYDRVGAEEMTQKDSLNAGWKFDHSYARLPEYLYSRVKPTPVKAPEMVIANDSLAKSLGLQVEWLHSNEAVQVFAGNSLSEGALPLAQAYAGHQFGHFTKLGDGRAILLGEHITPNGERFDIQLKGPGQTPYSRRGDGRAGLGPMLREYIISEAMHALGIPTTRSLAVVITGEPVYRETIQQGAILTRVASSHLRVGTFEYVAKWGSEVDIRMLADYTLQRHFSKFQDQDNRYLYLLKQVIERQAQLIAKWQLVGFIHGVMNTDNMTLCGETIDYGPCAFMNAYDPETVFSSIDTYGRYAYGNQPSIAAWNLARFAETLIPVLHENQEQALELARNAVAEFGPLYHSYWLSGMRAKLGLWNEEEQDATLIEELLTIMNDHVADYTNTFRALTLDTLEETTLYGVTEFNDWQVRWQARLGRQPQSESEITNRMKDNNPAVIPRNHRVEEALEAAVEGDYSVMEKLLHVISDPYAVTEEQRNYIAPPDSSCGPYRTFCGT